MFERIWTVFFGNLDATQLSFIFGILGFCWNQISIVLQRMRDAKAATAQEVLQQAVIDTANSPEARGAHANLETLNDIDTETGRELLEKSINTAITVAAARGLDLVKHLGGREGVKVAAQATFKGVKNSLRRDK